MRRTLLPALLLLACRAGLLADEAPSREYKKAPGPHTVEAVKLEWKDDKRAGRVVPVKAYYPKDATGPSPVIVFSHGLGGTRDGYEYAGRHWASHGYVCVHLQHAGSDDAVWKGSRQPQEDLRKAARNPANAVNRPLDVRFAIDQLARAQKEDKRLKGRLDLDRLGMAGHSFGAYTTLAAVGQVFPTSAGKEAEAGDRRIKAAVIMSPTAPRTRAGLDRAYGRIKVPCLHLTGTRDGGVGITETKPADRRLPFEHIKGADQYLVVFEGGDHMVFAAPKRKAGAGAKDAVFLDLVRMSTTAFWDAHLKGEAGAKAWLQGGGLKQALGRDGTFEHKAPAKP
jgi:predicted dienelactone hydrolase